MLLLVSVENTRKVSRNLGCKSNCDDNNINRVDVLIPEVIMVLPFSRSFQLKYLVCYDGLPMVQVKC